MTDCCILVFVFVGECLSLGDEYLDEVVGGGLVEGITELVGEAGCGKTQMAMHLLLQVSRRCISSTSFIFYMTISSSPIRVDLPSLVSICL